nr:F-box domain, leucine-rich repeat domain, L domain-like protein [Tanacetum cinerariifolium]
YVGGPELETSLTLIPGTERKKEILKEISKEISKPRPGLTMWRRSGGNVLRTLRLASGISTLSFGMIPGPLPEPLKIGKTGQRARSYLDRDPGRLLAFEMRWMRTDEEMRRLEAMGTYTDDEINRLAIGGTQRGHIARVGRVLPARATASPSTPAHESTLNSLHKKVDFMMSIFKSNSKYSDMFSQFESGGASRSGGCEDEEEGADHQEDDDEDGDGDT